MENKVPISKKSNPRGEDSYKTFSVRVKVETVEALERIAVESNRSRNELVNIFLDYGVGHYEIVK